MNWDRIKSNWQQYRGQVAQQWSRLTDADLDVIGGERQLLSGRIQEAYGISKDEAERQIRRFEEMPGKDVQSRNERRAGSGTHAPQR